MQNNGVKVLGNDRQMYEVADFVSVGKTYLNAA